MKRFLMILLTMTILGACSDSLQTPYGHIEPAGLFEERHLCIVYEWNAVDVFWSIVLIESVLFPVLILGWDVFEPVGWHKNCSIQWEIVR